MSRFLRNESNDKILKEDGDGILLVGPNVFYITSGLPAIDYLDSPPSGDNKYFITAGLIADDYVIPIVVSFIPCNNMSTFWNILANWNIPRPIITGRERKKSTINWGIFKPLFRPRRR